MNGRRASSQQHDITAEQCTLGAMLLASEAIAPVAEVLRPQDYLRPAHQMIHMAILRLRDRGDPTDAVAVAAELTRSKEIRQCGGAAYLHDLIAKVPTVASAAYYARLVRRQADKRRVREVASRLHQAAEDPGCDITEAVSRASAELSGIGIHETTDDEQAVLNPIPAYPIDALCGPLYELASNTRLPAGLVAGAGLGALGGLCGPARLIMPGGTSQRSIVWSVLLALSSGGKTPAQNRAFARLRRLDADRYDQYRVEREEWKKDRAAKAYPTDPRRRFDDFTFEVLARRLDRGDGTGVVEADELSGFLSSLGQYKSKGSNSDIARLLTLWNGFPWDYERVGDNRSGGIGIEISIPDPVVSVCGGLQPHLHQLLGDAQSGLRPRWLPHLVPAQIPEWDDTAVPREWEKIVEELYVLREPRDWELSGTAKNEWAKAGNRWRQQIRDGAESTSVIAALGKADIQCARIALVIAESLEPGKGGELPAQAMRTAIAITDYVLGCWRALPDGEPLALSRRDEVLHRGVDELVSWLERHGGRAARRDIQRAHVAGVRTAGDLDALLGQYRATYPGCVRNERAAARGPVGVVVYAPTRAAHSASPELFSSTGTETVAGDSFGSVPAEDRAPELAGQEVAAVIRETVATGDSFSGDSFLATVSTTQSRDNGGWPEGSIGAAAQREAIR